jgi:hypothetical protein
MCGGQHTHANPTIPPFIFDVKTIMLYRLYRLSGFVDFQLSGLTEEFIFSISNRKSGST